MYNNAAFAFICAVQSLSRFINYINCLALKLKGSEVVLERLRQWAATRPNVTKMNLIDWKGKIILSIVKSDNEVTIYRWGQTAHHARITWHCAILSWSLPVSHNLVSPFCRATRQGMMVFLALRYELLLAPGSSTCLRWACPVLNDVELCKPVLGA